MEQNYPDGDSNEANIQTVIHNCIQYFYELEDFYDSEKLLEIFLKLVNQADNPSELYQHFHQKGFAMRLTKFYVNWAWNYESANNYKLANEILQKGFQNEAKPLTDLIYAEEQIQIRLAKAIATGQVGQEEDGDKDEGERQALNCLKGKTKKGKIIAPVKRVGQDAVQQRFGQNANQQFGQIPINKQFGGTTVKQSNKIQVYQDENEGLEPRQIRGLKPAKGPSNDNDCPQPRQIKTIKPTGPFDENEFPAVKPKDIKGVPKVAKSKVNEIKMKSNGKVILDVGKENVKKPEKWCDNKIIQDVNVMKNINLGFEILEDEQDENQAKATGINTKALKESQKESPKKTVFEAKIKPGTKLMFNVKKVYAGSEEYSFEELMARKYYEKKKEEDDKRRTEKLEEEVAQLRETIAMLLQNQQKQQQQQQQVKLKKLLINSQQENVNINDDETPKIFETPETSSSGSGNSKSNGSNSISKGALSLVRELWNGTLAPTLTEDQIVGNPKHDVNDNEKFNIYSDSTMIKLQQQGADQTDFNQTEAFTIVIPKDEIDFYKMCPSSSTPLCMDKLPKWKQQQNKSQEQRPTQYTGNNFVGGLTAKLSPIVETSKEYYSKSSSSSGTLTTGGSTAHSLHSKSNKLTWNNPSSRIHSKTNSKLAPSTASTSHHKSKCDL